MPIKKNHQDKCLKRSWIFFLLTFGTLLYLVSPLPVKLATAELFKWLGEPWNYLLANIAPIILYFFFLVIMNIFFFEGKDGYTTKPNWKALKNACLYFIIGLGIGGIILVWWLFFYVSIFVAWLGFMILFVDAFILCKSAYDKENPKNVVGKRRNI